MLEPCSSYYCDGEREKIMALFLKQTLVRTLWESKFPL